MTSLAKRVPDPCDKGSIFKNAVVVWRTAVQISSNRPLPACTDHHSNNNNSETNVLLWSNCHLLKSTSSRNWYVTRFLSENSPRYPRIKWASSCFIASIFDSVWSSGTIVSSFTSSFRPEYTWSQIRNEPMYQAQTEIACIIKVMFNNACESNAKLKCPTTKSDRTLQCPFDRWRAKPQRLRILPRLDQVSN